MIVENEDGSSVVFRQGREPEVRPAAPMSELRAEEPEAGWRIESRGTHSGWHPVED
jgi:hypothetical protein